jgi:dethiobiotin synthetase
MASYFVTATGTELGKTYVTAGLVRAAAEVGRRFAAVKPVVSGYTPETAAGSDPALLLAAMGKRVTHKAIEAISPWRFAAPLSPDMAAAREGRRLDLAELQAFCRAAMSAAPEGLLIEGVGGVAVPLVGTVLVADWISRLRVPAILVAGTYLGTLSHTITAAEALVVRGVAVAAVVLSESVASPVPPEETAQVLRRLLPHPVHVIPRDLNDRSFRALMANLE